MNITVDRKVIEQALEALEKKHGHWGKGHDDLNASAITALRTALEQPKQEPVAWAGVDFSIDCTPPQRKPLTEEEINRIDGATPFHEDTAWLIRFARAIERAHGIGGSDEN